MPERIALVAVPFAICRMPLVGISLLKSVVRQKGFECDIHYFNLALAAQIGFDEYTLLAERMPTEMQIGEWLFASMLFGKNSAADHHYVSHLLGDFKDTITPAIVLRLLDLRDEMAEFVRKCFEAVDWSRYRIVGFSAGFQQLCASLALARLIKTHYPDTQIVFGGANCIEAMGVALSRIFPFIDFVCLGEGDVAFPALVENLLNGSATPVPSIPGILARADGAAGAPVTASPLVSDLDTLPYPDFDDYFASLSTIQTPPDFWPEIPLETSRGCWWGQLHHCTFCGVNDYRLAFRSKSPRRVLDELTYLSQNYGSRIFVVDTVLDYRYFRTLLPELAASALNLSIFWEVRANLKREQIALLAQAGIKQTQPGIESLSDAVLRLMNKGTTRLQNIATLKWAKQFGIAASDWNYLYGFPGEDPQEYISAQQLFPLLYHLEPPLCGHILIERFSPYWANPAAYGITRLTPMEVYRWIYHSLDESDLNALVYVFDAEYPDESASYAPGLIQAVKEWQTRTDAVLDVFPSSSSIRIVDTRTRGETREYRFEGLAAELYLLCDAPQSVRALMDTPSVRRRATEEQVIALLNQFVEQGLMLREGKQYLSLAVVRDAMPAASPAQL